MKKLNNKYLDIHADDYGLSKNSDKDIISLCKEGKLNSISIIPNLEIFKESVDLFSTEKNSFPNSVKVSVHLNFMEGKCCCEKSSVRDLVDEDGFFTVTWGRLFIWNFIPFKRQIIKNQLKKEIEAQISRCIENGICDENAIRIDSHQHPHMIPLVFDAIIEVIKEKNYKIEYIRNTLDPIHFYIFNGGLKGLSVANIIKCCLLNFFSIHSKKIIKKLKLPVSYLCGVFFSGRMDKRIETAIPTFLKKSEKNNYITELLFHPGTMLENELTDEFKKKGFNEFHLSENRKIEYEEISSLII